MWNITYMYYMWNITPWNDHVRLKKYKKSQTLELYCLCYHLCNLCLSIHLSLSLSWIWADCTAFILLKLKICTVSHSLFLSLLQLYSVNNFLESINGYLQLKEDTLALSVAAQRIEGCKIEGLSEEIDKVNNNKKSWITINCSCFAYINKANRKISTTVCSWVLLLWFDEPGEGGGTKCHTEAIDGRNFEGQKEKGHQGKWKDKQGACDILMIFVLTS